MKFLDNLKKDWQFVHGVFKALRKVTPITRHPTHTYADAVEDLARRYGDRPALLSDRETLTYAEYDGRGNRYARWAMAHGVGKGDTVCLLMPNRPEYAAIWLGVARAGGATALLNTNLVGSALAHSINLVSPKHIIVATEFARTFADAISGIELETTVWLHGGSARGVPRIDTEVMEHDDSPIPSAERPAITQDDECLYIYTSGTTGLPKAARISHYRVQAAMLAYASFMETGKDDRNYSCLPMYHSSGGILAIGCCLMVGGSVFVRERFSASQFWDDVVDNDCTRFQYIGELCRYLLNAPPHPKERKHRIALCCGNGLRPDVWLPFRDRFGIGKIREFYAATEGNAIIFNWDGTPGAVGRIPRWAHAIFPVANVRIDLERETPVRGEDGLCIECDSDTIGEVISRIVVNPIKAGQRFDGYVNKVETEKKIIRDVFVAGDMWFRTGDLMRRDERGYFFFVDRIGDTFRWKGENVSTAEVAEALSRYPGVDDASVYGVAIAGTDGRAGMAAIAVNEHFELEAFRDHVHAALAVHARPLFIRLQPDLDVTGTFKTSKLKQIGDGFDPSKTDDPIYFDDPAAGNLVRVDDSLFRRISSGEVRL